MQQVFIGYGANLGDKAATLARILRRLALNGSFESIRTSSLYLTEPEGAPDQPVFLNCVIACGTSLAPHLLLRFLKDLERGEGRIDRGRWREREADLDILLYGDAVISSRELIIPHPAMHERVFVLEPLSEIAPSSIHPLLGVDIETVKRRRISAPNVPWVEKVVDRRALLINNGPVHLPERIFSF